MAETIRIIESNFDNLEVQRVFVAEVGGRPELHAIVGGVECYLDGKPSTLPMDIVSCWPLDAQRAADWPIYSDLEIAGVRDRYWGVAIQPRLAQAVRDFQQRQAAAAA